MVDGSYCINASLEGEVFEGPEKKLEVFFGKPASAAGFRQFDQATWSELLEAASCSILHCKANAHFDAYLLSESSMFVYPNKVILKTCGTTGLLLVLPKLLSLAERIGAAVENVHYGRYRYKFPQHQLYPHTSFDQEREYLAHYFGNVSSRVLGPPDGRCWFVLCARPEPEKVLPSEPEGFGPQTSPRSGEDIFEVAMEGLSLDVCRRFFESSHPQLSGRPLAAHMTAISGIGALLPDVDIDDWAFEPCGYSMNGQRGEYYYTIHITPEEGFSYASFETNDPQYRQPSRVQDVVAVFAPSVLTATLTTRRTECELLTYKLSGFEPMCLEVANFHDSLSVCSINFCADGPAVRKRKLAAAPSAELMLSSEGFESWASSKVDGSVQVGAVVVVA